nr:salicylyl-CoA 5-hydroxylase [Klebsiella pneumoniae]
MSHLLARRELVNSPLITVSLSPRCVSTPPTRVSRPPAPDPSWPTGFLRRRPVNSGSHGGRACGAYFPGDLGLWDDETENALRGVVEDIRAWSPIRLGIQLGHAGRKASCAAPWLGGHQLALNDGGWQTVAPSAVAFHDGDRAPLN